MEILKKFRQMDCRFSALYFTFFAPILASCSSMAETKAPTIMGQPPSGPYTSPIPHTATPILLSSLATQTPDSIGNIIPLATQTLDSIGNTLSGADLDPMVLRVGGIISFIVPIYLLIIFFKFTQIHKHESPKQDQSF